MVPCGFPVTGLGLFAKLPSSRGLGPTSELTHSRYRQQSAIAVLRRSIKGSGPFSAYSTFGRISPGFTPEPHTLRIWLPVRVLQVDVTVALPSGTLPAFSSQQRFWDSGLQRVPPRSSRFASPRRFYPPAVFPTFADFPLVSGGSCYQHHFATLTFLTPSPLSALQGPLPLGPVPALASDQLQGFEPLARSLTQPPDIPPSAGQIRSCPFAS